MTAEEYSTVLLIGPIVVFFAIMYDVYKNRNELFRPDKADEKRRSKASYDAWIGCIHEALVAQNEGDQEKEDACWLNADRLYQLHHKEWVNY